MGIFFKAKKSGQDDDEEIKELPDDTVLAFKAAKGDEASFEILVRKYERFVSTCVYQVVGNSEDTMDVSQEVFLKVYRSLSTFKGDSSFSSWLFRVAKNCAYDFVRKKKLPSVSIDSTENEEGSAPEIPDTDIKSRPEDLALRNERHELLWKAMKQLSDEHREVITLRDINGYTYERIAEMLELEPGTVKSRLFRARESLRKLLSKENYF